MIRGMIPGSAAPTMLLLRDGPGGGAEIVPGHYHTTMNMYIAVCKNANGGKAHYEVIDKATMVDPKEC